MSSLVDGLTKRPPTTHVAQINNKTFSNPYVHFIDRDEVEKYVVLVYPDGIQVSGPDGTLYPVLSSVDYSYLNCATPVTQIKCLTVTDTTFIVNRTTPTGMDGTRSPVMVPEALIWIRQGAYDSAYVIKVGGVTASYTTSATDAATIQTTNIAQQLSDQLTAGLSSGSWTVTHLFNTISIKRVDGKKFSCSANDSIADDAMSMVLNSVARFDLLPDSAPNGYVCLVKGNADQQQDDYWVQFTTTDGTSYNRGTWSETVQPNIRIHFNRPVMPHVLIRKQDTDGSITGKTGQIYFSFEEGQWQDRECGDNTSNPVPSFNGLPISDVFLYRGRLGFLANGFVCMSQANNLENFFKQTALTLLDDDRIDTPVAHSRAVNLRHALPFNNELLIFADHTQFSLTGGDILSPKTVAITVATEYSSHIDCPPVHADSYIYFPYDNGAFSGMREYGTDGYTQQKNAKEVTPQCPRYITGSIHKLAVSPTTNSLFALTDNQRNRVWVYQWFWNGQEKVQSSWSHWTLGNNTVTIGIGFLGDDLYIVNVYADGTFLERVKLDPGEVDQFAEWVTHVDRRITDTDPGVSIYYDANANQTTIRPPFVLDPAEDWVVITRATMNPRWVPGRVLTVVSKDTRSVTVEGDATSGVWLGRSYEMRYTFGKAMLHTQSPVGGLDSITNGRTQLKDWSIKFFRSGYFRAEVTPAYRDTVTFPMTGQVPRVPGLRLGGLGRVQIRDGVMRFPVMSKNDQVTIELVNDSHLPCYITGAEWVANFIPTAKRI